MSQEERSTLWEVIVSVILSKNIYMKCVLFRKVSEVELFECTTANLLLRKRYYVYVMFLMPVFIVQVTELVEFVINVRKIPPSTSLNFATRVKIWRVVRLIAS